MLKIIDGGSVTPLDFDRYYILEAYDGRDSLGFTLPLEHPQYPLIAEETPLMDAESGQRYLVKAIDEGPRRSTSKRSWTLTSCGADLRMDYTNSSDTAAGTIGAVLPAGWSRPGTTRTSPSAAPWSWRPARRWRSSRPAPPPLG